ncbi:hypothetical protein WME76_25645 [Sorangium sp. So ce119]|uniref:hypothetical protein n=1 Tax=Sorangium sp. So ce119 TaxID=3133279 RepID=UPI003F6482A0
MPLWFKFFPDVRYTAAASGKEFFRIELDELAVTVEKCHGEIEFARIAEAKEYRQTLAKRQAQEAAKPAGAPLTPAPSQVEQVAAYAAL